MDKDTRTTNILLLRTAAITLLLALVLAWCLTFTKALKLPFFVATFQNYDMLLSAHLDFLMMTMLLLGFYAARIALPLFVQWPMAIGSITNPALFFVGSVMGDIQNPVYLGIVFISISLTSFGYAMAAITILRRSFNA